MSDIPCSGYCDSCMQACCRDGLRDVLEAAERVLGGAKTGLDNEAIIALYYAVAPYRASTSGSPK